MRKRAKKYINITALKRWLEAAEPFVEDDEVLAFKEYKEREAHKNGVNSESVGEVIKSRLAGTGGGNTNNGGE